MNEGRLPYNTYVRCTDKTLTCAAGGIARADCSGGVSLVNTEEGVLCISSAGGACEDEQLLEMYFYRCVNALCAGGAAGQILSAHIHIPQELEERELRARMQLLDSLCAKHDMTLLPAELCVTRAVSAPCIALSAVGKQTVRRRLPKEGDTLLFAGSAGLFGTGMLLTRQRGALLKRFSESFLLQAQEKVLHPDITRALDVLSETQLYVLPVAEGGVLTALWDLKCVSGLGFEAELRAVPMEQEVVEIAEFLGANPYQLAGDGAALLASDEPEAVCEKLLAAGIHVSPIGTVTHGPAGNIRKDDEISSVSRPEPDELFRFL